MNTARPAGDRATVSNVGAVLTIALAVVLAATVAPPLWTMANGTSRGVQAGADLTSEPGSDGSVAVAFVERGDAEYLTVNATVETDPGSNAVEVASGSTTLREPGDSVTFEEAPGNAEETIEVTVTVVAVRGDERALVLKRTGKL